MLMNERARLLRVVGAAAVLVANSDAKSLPNGAVEAAEMLSETLNVAFRRNTQGCTGGGTCGAG